MSNSIPTIEKINIVCPKCEEQNVYELIEFKPIYNFKCPKCQSDFTSKIVKIRSKHSRGSKREYRRYFSIRVIYFSNNEELIEFTNVGYEDFELRAKDLAIFSYVKNDLKIIQNCTIGIYMKVSSPSCFIATYLYGQNSDEVTILRLFRDEILLKSTILSPMVNIYYHTSVKVLDRLGQFRLFKIISLFMMNPIIFIVNWHFCRQIKRR